MSCVDVVVPCYRYGHYLEQCVSSVLEQQGVDVRVLILDDCSPDNTLEVARSLSLRDGRVTFRRHAVNRGHIATYNEGIEWVSAPYYLLLSADDYLLPGALGRTAQFLDAHSSVGLAFGQQITLYGETKPSCVQAQAAVSDWELFAGLSFIRASGAKNCVPTPAAVVRTDLQKRVGGYRADLPHSGDMEMWMRLALRADVGVSKEIHAVYRSHANNMSLGYMRQHWLPDVQQRKTAIDQLLVSDAVPSHVAQSLHDAATRLLALEAVSFASSAFNANELQVSRQLREFAVAISPGVKTSQPWWKLQLKLSIGCEGWLRLRDSFSMSKGTAPGGSSLKDGNR